MEISNRALKVDYIQSSLSRSISVFASSRLVISWFNLTLDFFFDTKRVGLNFLGGFGAEDLIDEPRLGSIVGADLRECGKMGDIDGDTVGELGAVVFVNAAGPFLFRDLSSDLKV